MHVPVISMPIAIRSATLDDVPAIRDIERQSTSASHWSTEQYEKLLQNGIVLVAEQAGTLCGFISAQAAAGEWEIENVVIARDFLRQGVASGLVHKIIAGARNKNASTVLLEVRESNRAARSLYEKLNFLEVGRRTKYYREPQEDAVLYAIQL
jgi:ribosomal-protein-alanine acetyltransferase